MIEAFAVAQEGGGKAEQIVRVAVGLSGNAVGVVRDNRAAVLGGKGQDLVDYGVQGRADFGRLLAQNRHAHRRENVLARAACMQDRDFGTCGGNHHGLVVDVLFDAPGSVGLGGLFHLVNAAGRKARRLFVDKPLRGVDDNACLVDEADPVKLVVNHLFSPKKDTFGSDDSIGSEKIGRKAFFSILFCSLRKVV